MLYTELLKLWDEAVRAIDSRDWQGALTKLNQITDHNCRTMFVMASTHIALGQVDLAVKALDQVIAKDSCLAVGFFQRSAVHMMANRLEEALADCIWAQKNMRENPVIDYKQLGLRYKMYSWQVLYNAAAVHSRLQQWDKAQEILTAASQERGAGKSNLVDTALEAVSVITSLIPNDDFGGFDPLRPQKPGYYEPKVEDGQDSRYMIMKSACVAKGAGELTVPAGAKVFLYSDDDKDGLAVVIYDGKRGLVPSFLLEPMGKKNKAKNKRIELANGIPHPPGLKPPNRPQGPSQRSLELQPSYAGATHTTPPTTGNSTRVPTQQVQTSPQESGSVIVKVHYTYTMALRVPLETSFRDLQDKITEKLGQPATNIRLRHRKDGTRALIPVSSVDRLDSLEGVAESGRAQIWCQNEDPLANRTILYQMVALYDYNAQGPEDLEFSEGDTIDILSEVNDEWLEGHVAGNIGIFPRSFAQQDTDSVSGTSTD
ncbi:Neutrophil cytosol factor 2 [Labeo rohita]|uniref:Neutrophil cytosol factor 2 n=1 Tax=Labeo rohita TaxID=84645 RepID=A0ABQ8MPE1_LABRO|nr:Neutrophil cytosol factor 2 [Labeo rohita]